jgi:hypothetical protein
MKKFFTIVLVIIVILALAYYFYISNSGIVTAEIDGHAFKTNKCGYLYSPGKLYIIAEQDAPEKITIWTNLNVTEVGTYSLNADNARIFGGNSAALFIGETMFAFNTSLTGSFTITKLDLEEKKVSGTFAFRAIQFQPPESKIVNITNGKFEDIPIGQQK